LPFLPCASLQTLRKKISAHFSHKEKSKEHKRAKGSKRAKIQKDDKLFHACIPFVT
jgi:hypothetical protein